MLGFLAGRPSFWGLLLGLGLSGCETRPRDNVLVITVDTLRADHLGCYGYGLARTPRIDRLAAEGLRCTNAMASAPITMPSHASLFTGLFPPAHGVRDNGTDALGPEALTLAERLQSAGYQTQAFVSALVLNRRYGLTQGFDGYDDDLWSEDRPRLFLIRERPAAKTADRAIAWLQDWHRQASGQPFFVWVHFFDPHQPYEPLLEDRLLARSPYDAEIAAVDRAVGRLVDTLDQMGTLDRTWLALTADHGESLGQHGEKTHGIFVYDATLWVPLILRRPGLIPQGQAYEGPVRSVDILPTLLAGLGLPPGPATQGVDLLPAFGGKAQTPDLPQYSESRLAELGFGMAPLYSLRQGNYRWIRAPRPELYDLAQDPLELNNLASADPARSAQMDTALTQLLQHSQTFAVQAGHSPMDSETAEMLQALGYLAPEAERRSLQGLDPKDGIALYQKLEEARHLAQRQDWPPAEAVLREVLAEAPGNVSALNVLGVVLLRQGRLSEARQRYLESLDLEPGQARVHALLGDLALAQAQMAEAERQYLRAIQLTPGFVEALANLGFISMLRQDDAAAQQWYEKAQAADPTFPRVHRLMADRWYQRGEFARALASYRKVLETHTSDFEVWVQVGACERRVGNPAGAVEAFKHAEGLRPDSWIPTYNLACLRAVQGQADLACQHLRQAIDKGLHDRQLLETDPDLDSLRPLPAFLQLLTDLTSQPAPAAVSTPQIQPTTSKK